MIPHFIRAGLTKTGVATSRPTAFLIVLVYTAVWLIVDRKSFDFHGVATLATWLMTLFIQRAEHRDTQGIQAKLDEILRALGDARNDVSRIDEEEPEEIEAHRRRATAKSGAAKPRPK